MKIPNLNNVKNVINVGKAFAIAHRPEMLFGMSVAASVGSTVLAGIGGYKARGLVEQERFDQGLASGWSRDENDPDISTKDKIQLTWQCYLPSAFALTTAVGSTTGLHLVHLKDKKAIVQASAVALEEAKQMYSKWEQETLAEIGPEKVKEIQNSIYEKNADENGVFRGRNADGVLTEKYIVRDGFTGRDIWSSKEEIEDALNETNNWINNEGDVELNHFYGLAGFDHVPQGDDIGWSGQLVEIKWDLTTREDGRPVRRFTFREAPEKDYTGKYA